MFTYLSIFKRRESYISMVYLCRYRLKDSRKIHELKIRNQAPLRGGNPMEREKEIDTASIPSLLRDSACMQGRDTWRMAPKMSSHLEGK